jgi:hypothetical protein
MALVQPFKPAQQTQITEPPNTRSTVTAAAQYVKFQPAQHEVLRDEEAAAEPLGPAATSCFLLGGNRGPYIGPES